jgi:hypothetical protein
MPQRLDEDGWWWLHNKKRMMIGGDLENWNFIGQVNCVFNTF